MTRDATLAGAFEAHQSQSIISVIDSSTSNYTILSSDVLIPSTEFVDVFVIPLLANRTYFFSSSYLYNIDPSDDFKIRITAPSGSSGYSALTGSSTVYSLGDEMNGTGQLSDRHELFEATVKTGSNPGNLLVQFRLNVDTSGNDGRILNFSWIKKDQLS